jgi:hypothetical protein
MACAFTLEKEFRALVTVIRGRSRAPLTLAQTQRFAG